ncbi:PTS sugar transporter subunit IIA [Enterococcus gallinarum]|nr:PTS sugar transporter subunit IIA [Enterococcus gallinarum]
MALVHAEIEKGALKDAVGLTTLKDPVEFGNKDNDPVKYLFCLSAVTKDRHLKTLSDLSAIMESEKFYDFVDNATSEKDVAEFIKNS